VAVSVEFVDDESSDQAVDERTSVEPVRGLGIDWAILAGRMSAVVHALMSNCRKADLHQSQCERSERDRISQCLTTPS
jgi:hypothetical protein